MSGGLLEFTSAIPMIIHYSSYTVACATYKTGLDHDLTPVSVCGISVKEGQSSSRMDMYSWLQQACLPHPEWKSPNHWESFCPKLFSQQESRHAIEVCIWGEQPLVFQTWYTTRSGFLVYSVSRAGVNNHLNHWVDNQHQSWSDTSP